MKVEKHIQQARASSVVVPVIAASRIVDSEDSCDVQRNAAHKFGDHIHFSLPACVELAGCGKPSWHPAPCGVRAESVLRIEPKSRIRSDGWHNCAANSGDNLFYLTGLNDLAQGANHECGGVMRLLQSPVVIGETSKRDNDAVAGSDAVMSTSHPVMARSGSYCLWLREYVRHRYPPVPNVSFIKGNDIG